MKVEKEVTVTVEVEVNQKDLINAIWTKEDAKKLIVEIDDTIGDWGFTVDLVTTLLNLLNYNQDEVNFGNNLTVEFIEQLKLAMENFTDD